MGNFNRLLVATAAAASVAAPAPAGAESTPQQQEHFLESAADNPLMYIKAAVLDAYNPRAVVEVTDKRDPGILMVKPFVIRNGKRIVSYAARSFEGGESHIETLAASQAKVQEYIGHRAVTVRRPRALVVERIVHAISFQGASPPAFTDSKELYAFEP